MTGSQFHPSLTLRVTSKLVFNGLVEAPMNSRRPFAAALLMIFLLPIGARGEDSPKAGDVRLEKRKYKTWSGKTGEYEVGTIFVKENRNEPDSRIISIGFSRFRSEKPTAPPLFFLPGGPGNSFQ